MSVNECVNEFMCQRILRDRDKAYYDTLCKGKKETVHFSNLQYYHFVYFLSS